MRNLFIVLLLSFVTTTFAQTVVVQDDITLSTVWTNDNTYVLDGLIFVEEGADLHIEQGTVIKALKQENITTGDEASALIIRRGARILAEGTASQPIIFTSEDDVDLNSTTDLNATDRGLWGGLIILGYGVTNQPTTQNLIEGIPPELEAYYGGENDADDSGVLRYVSIRHGGFSISGVPGDEINGISFGAVGSGTTVEHIEVFANLDDGYEWWGGTVETKWLVAAACGDDAFDYDQGFRGKGQFWLAFQLADAAGRGGEHDGGDDDRTGEPYSMPTISNVTYLGSGADSSPEGDGNDWGIRLRENAGGKYYNGIVTGYAGSALRIDDDETVDRFNAGDIEIKNMFLWNFGDGSDLASVIRGPEGFEAYLTANGNQFVDPGLRSIDRTPSGELDLRPALGSPAATSAISLEDPFFDNISFSGAFSPYQALWTDGWTALDAYGYTGTAGDPGTPEQMVVSEDITVSTIWTNDNEYVLDGLIFVEEGAVLTIEPGTVIKARKQENIESGDEASALIIRRGAKIMAEGSASAPIIFTSEDDVDLTSTTDLNATDRGLWGGLIILGYGVTNQPTTQNLIEGIPPELEAYYGGENDADDSGVLRYVSIRHGGFSISGVPGDEINGISFGAVGSGTTVEHIEVFANLDDGYEWWGGTVECRWLAAVACGDDAFDYDQGFRGKGQFWFALQLADAAGRGGEHDGGDDDRTGEPYSMPSIANATYIGSGAGSSPEGDGNDWGIRLRENAGGKYYKSIITDYAGSALRIDDDETVDRFNAGDIVISGNFFWSFGDGADLASVIRGPEGFETYLTTNLNQFTNPGLVNIDRTPTGALDPRPALGAAAANGAVAGPGDDWFWPTAYAGAFEPGLALWTEGWTALDAYGYTSDVVTDVDDEQVVSSVPAEFELSQNYPNPFNPSTVIRFSLPEASNVSLRVYNMLGQEVAQLVNDVRSAGTHEVTFNAADLASGIYVYRLQTGVNVMTKKMMLLK